MTRAGALALAALVACMGCAAEKQREPATAGASRAERAAREPERTSTPAADAADGAYASPPGQAPAGAGAGGAPADTRTMALHRAERQLDVARRELEVAAGDCHNACRALGSMDRAAGRLCALADTPDAAPRCEDAKRILYAARDGVRATCGDCPGGPSVERDAPVPSR